MDHNIQQLFYNFLREHLQADVSEFIIDFKTNDNDGNLQIIATIDNKIIPKIKKFAINLESHQKQLANILNVKQVNIIFTAQSRGQPAAAHDAEKHKIPNVGKVIMVASGKGGVGKSTFAALLALYLKSCKNKRIGLVDLDVYGPSIPHIFDVSQKPAIEDGKMLPINKNGIELMSAGFLIEKSAAAIWRGPMVNKAVHQMLGATKWGARKQLDYLIIDTPPGTGDIHISVLEKYDINHAIIVSTPNALAVNDVLKSLNLFEITGLNIAAHVVNMQYLMVDSKRHMIFGDCNTGEALSGVPQVGLPIISQLAQKPTAKNMVLQLPKILDELDIVFNHIS